ncbi:hypothetical protein [Streptacidiphilus jiangxiensis]|nr:hypothetical protein [Streptacidiphilus jiangxiensis]
MSEMNSAEARLGWLDDRTLRWKLRQATTLMLEAVADIIDGEGLTLSGALPGGAEYACEHTGLPDQYAPLVEAEAVGYLARTLARTPTSLFNGNLTYFVWKIDTLPHEKQSKLLRRTAAAYNRCLPATAASPEPGDAPTVPYVVGRYQSGPYVGFAALTRHPDGRRGPAR